MTKENPNENIPLAYLIRPESLDTVVGQEHLIGEGKPLRLAVEGKKKFSFVLWGPPGVGKTTIARIYANSLEANFVELSAVSTGIKDVREVVEKAKKSSVPTILFLDEIHRYNKAQQDFLLPFVESGVITLIGATTENPSFEIISPLLSRTRVFVLKPLEENHLEELIKKAITHLKTESITDEVKDFLVAYANGDGRQLLTLISTTFDLFGDLSLESLKKAVSSLFVRFDKKGDQHYDTISAFIKSMRASDPNAAVYYLARLLEGGEDPKFIARRMVIFASEDIGMAQPTALVVANEVFRAVETIGLPEAAINLSHGAIYLSKAPKDRTVYDALMEAKSDVGRYGNLEIPMNIRNAPTKLMENMGYGKGYKQYDKTSHLPEKLRNKKYLKEE